MRISTFIVGIILFTGMVSGAVFVVGGFGQNYNVAADNPANYDKTSEIATMVSEMQNQTDNSQIQQSNIFVSSAQGGYTALKLTSKGLSFVQGFLNELGSTIGLPTFIVGTLTLLFVVLFVFMIIAFANRADV